MRLILISFLALLLPIVDSHLLTADTRLVGLSGDEPRLALVIGNGAYTKLSSLKNPANDARLIADRLTTAGFKVTLGLDLDVSAFKDRLKQFSTVLSQSSQRAIVVIYYAGHGVQVKGENYLLPIGANPRSEDEVPLEAIAANDVLRLFERNGGNVTILVLDACRNNPFRSVFRSSVRGLARMEAPSGALVAFATAPGDVAFDGDGQNSPYAESFAKVLTVPRLSIEQALKQVRRDVYTSTERRQTTWETSSLFLDVYLCCGGQNGGRSAHSGPRDAESVRLSDEALPGTHLVYQSGDKIVCKSGARLGVGTMWVDGGGRLTGRLRATSPSIPSGHLIEPGQDIIVQPGCVVRYERFGTDGNPFAVFRATGQ